MNNEIKIVANYLPQYHRIPENDRWWGEGFTDWKAVQAAQQVYPGHREPRIPLNGYYDLSKPECIKQQIDLANKYNIYGFAIYHYWFNSNLQLLQTPAEIILDHKEFKINYLFLWDNKSWTRTWSKLKKGNDWAPEYDQKEDDSDNGVLAELDYGTEIDWEKHFNYLLPFFKDDRYIKIDGKPLFGFFGASVKSQCAVLDAMSKCWDRLAKENGLPGVICMEIDSSYRKGVFDNKFLYSPFIVNSIFDAAISKVTRTIKDKLGIIKFYSYNRCWKKVLHNARHANNNVLALSGFVDFDDSPRRGEKGRIIKGASPSAFSKYLRQLIDIAAQKNIGYIFMTAWNEWGEGAYLEPDTINKYAYLEEIQKIIDTDQRCWKTES